LLKAAVSHFSRLSKDGLIGSPKGGWGRAPCARGRVGGWGMARGGGAQHRCRGERGRGTYRRRPVRTSGQSFLAPKVCKSTQFRSIINCHYQSHQLSLSVDVLTTRTISSHYPSLFSLPEPSVVTTCRCSHYQSHQLSLDLVRTSPGSENSRHW